MISWQYKIHLNEDIRKEIEKGEKSQLFKEFSKEHLKYINTKLDTSEKLKKENRKQYLANKNTNNDKWFELNNKYTKKLVSNLTPSNQFAHESAVCQITENGKNYLEALIYVYF